jgi:hypothetical protein
MSGSNIFKFSFGEDGVYYYIFNVHVYNVPGGNNKISTIMFLSTNTMNIGKQVVDPHLSELILFLAKLVVEHNASYDAYHNSFEPYSYEESEIIADQVNEKARELRKQI